MKKHFISEAHSIRLRLVGREDAQFLFNLRQVGDRDKIMHAVSDYAKHAAWLEEYLRRDDDYFFIGERLSDGIPVGTVAVYNIDFAARTAESGRWLAWPGRGHAIAMLILAYDMGFNSLNLERIYSQTIRRNRGVRRFLAAWGIERTRTLEPAILNGRMEEADEYLVQAENWPRVKEKMERMLSL